MLQLIKTPEQSLKIMIINQIEARVLKWSEHTQRDTCNMLSISRL